MSDQGHLSDSPSSRVPGSPRAVFFLSALTALVLAVAPGVRAAPAAKYYFQLHDVQSQVPINGDLRQYAGEALKAELASRPEWQSDLGEATGQDAIVAELKKRRLSGFDLIVKIAEVKKDIGAPKGGGMGGHLKKLSVSVKLAVLGTTLPGDKIAFGGDGEAGAEAEVSERRLDEESQSMLKDVIKDALKQAVDQAVLKLGMPKSAPMNESKRKHKKT